jgi:hypothetical protein
VQEGQEEEAVGGRGEEVREEATALGPQN